jgi:hypothetical protein
MVSGSDKVSATAASAWVSVMAVKQLPSLAKPIPCLRAWQATYSWPLQMTCAPKGGCPDSLIGVQRFPG